MTKESSKPSKQKAKPAKGKAAVKPPKRARPGQPAKFTDTQVMQDKIDSYFTECDTSTPPRPYTIAGLAYHLDMTTHSLRNYTNKEQFFTIINKARLKVERSFEERLSSGNSTGSIFWLKNHAGYKDKSEVEQSGQIIHKVIREIVKPQ